RTPLKAMTADSAAAASGAIDDALARMRTSAMDRDDAALILAEFETDAALARIALRLGRERILNGDVGTEQLPVATRRAIADELETTRTQFRKLWLARNRPGGLPDSTARMQTLIDDLRR
ncbi:MAG: hypothetical protein KJ579_00965, partial [Verrucomicrobia bacterium]|nr:hypothetical protein [Verrucomicrobiota bacterium]